MKGSFWSLIKNRSYRSYWLATAFSMGASNVLQFTLALYVLNKTGSPTLYASILSIIIIPRILLTPIAGVLADRKKKIKLMKVLNIITVLLMLIFSTISHLNKGDLHLILLYILVISLEIIEVFYQAPESSILPEIIEKDLLSEAAILARIDDGIVFIASPLLAAFLYSNFGITGSFITVTIMLSISVILNFFIKTPYEPKLKENTENTISQYWIEFKEGIEELRKNKFIKNYVIVAPCINFSFAATFQVVITYLLLEVYDVGEYVYGSYRAITSSMVIIVPLLVFPLVKKIREEKLLKIGSLSISISLMLIGLVVLIGGNYTREVQLKLVYLIALLDCIAIASIMPINIATQVFFQKNIEEEYRSRIMSVSRMIVLSSIPLGNMFYGFLASKLPAYMCIMIASVSIFLVFLFIRSQEEVFSG